MTEEEKAIREVVVTDLCRIICYTAILRIFHKLELQQFSNNDARNRDFQLCQLVIYGHRRTRISDRQMRNMIKEHHL